MAIFCSTLCTTHTAVRLAYAPCPTCPDTPTQAPPTPGPTVTTFNAPPSPNSVDPLAPNYFIAGTGIPVEFASVETDSVIELVLAPIVAGVAAIGPSVDGAYTIDLGPGQALGMVFGVTLQAPFRITQLYDVDLTVAAGSEVATLQLVRDTGTASGYRWTDGASYNIVDSDGNPGLTTVQNVTRLTYLVSGGLLEPDALDLGTSTWTLTATPLTGDADPVVLTVTVITS